MQNNFAFNMQKGRERENKITLKKYCFFPFVKTLMTLISYKNTYYKRFIAHHISLLKNLYLKHGFEKYVGLVIFENLTSYLVKYKNDTQRGFPYPQN